MQVTSNSRPSLLIIRTCCIYGSATMSMNLKKHRTRDMVSPYTADHKTQLLFQFKKVSQIYAKSRFLIMSTSKPVFSDSADHLSDICFSESEYLFWPAGTMLEDHNIEPGE